MKLQVFIAYVLSAVNAGYVGNNYGPNSLSQGGSFDGSYYQNANGYNSIGFGSGAKEEHVPVIVNGVPVDTPEVQHARAEHFRLYAQAAAAAERAPDNHGSGGDYQGDRQSYQFGQTEAFYQQPSTYNGYANSVSNQQPSSHFSSAVSHHRYRRGLGYSQFNGYDAQPQHVPIITKEGVPLETPEVQAAKAQHYQAHANANSGHSEWRQGGGYGGDSYGNGYSNQDFLGGSNNGWNGYGAQANQVQYSISHDNNYGGWQRYHGPQHIPILDKHGVPLETPEVQAAKEQHFLAHSQAQAKKYGQGWQQQQTFGGYGQYSGSNLAGSFHGHGPNITPDGVPEETPEVQIAKAQHFAAHAHAQQNHGQWAGQSGSDYDDGYSGGGSQWD